MSHSDMSTTRCPGDETTTQPNPATEPNQQPTTQGVVVAALQSVTKGEFNPSYLYILPRTSLTYKPQAHSRAVDAIKNSHRDMGAGNIVLKET